MPYIVRRPSETRRRGRSVTRPVKPKGRAAVTTKGSPVIGRMFGAPATSTKDAKGAKDAKAAKDVKPSATAAKK